MNQPSNEYWAERFAQLEALAHELGIEIYVEVQNDYQRAVKEIIRELAEWYSVILEDDVSYAEVQKLLTNKQVEDFRMDVDDYIKLASQAEIAESWQKTLEKAAARQRITRLDSIMVKLQQHIESLFGKQEKLLYDGLQKLYEQEYYHTAFEIEKGFGVGHEFGGVNTDKLEAILKKPWAPDGANFSDRVWKHKENLVSTLRQELVRAAIRGDDFRTATKNLSNKMNVSQSAAGRLVMTESAFFASKSMADCMEEFDVEEYQFVATLDMRTSTICRDMDKKVFKMKDFAPGTTAPPLHCHCRSHISPYFADAAISERVARGQDGKTYMIPSNMNYRDWERVYVKKEISLEDWKKSLNKKGNDGIIEIRKLMARKSIVEMSFNDVTEIGKNISERFDISKHLGDKQKIKEIYSNFREMGGTVEFAKGSYAQNKQMLTAAFSYYPKIWADFLNNEGKKIYTVKVARGFFCNGAVMGNGKRYETKFADFKNGYISIHMNGVRKTTPYHEIGHMVEYINPNALRLSKEFLSYRTAGENFVRLKDIFQNSKYGLKEVTKKDDFISPYIGKEYKNATEVLSMGLEQIFEPTDFSKNMLEKKRITDDEEYFYFILGMLALA